MPQGDGTGPLGQGPLTGRGFGDCVETQDQSGAFYPRRWCRRRVGFRRGFGAGAGSGRGLSPGFWSARATAGFQGRVVLSKQQERKVLEQELKEIQAEEQEIKNQLKDLEDSGFNEEE